MAFDVHAPTFRHEMYAAYKGTRKPMPEELREQVPLLKQVLRAMGILTIEKPGLEADDILGTLAKQAEKDGIDFRGQGSVTDCRRSYQNTNSQNEGRPYRGGRLLCEGRGGRLSGDAPSVYRVEGVDGRFGR